jgi:galactokinase
VTGASSEPPKTAPATGTNPPPAGAPGSGSAVPLPAMEPVPTLLSRTRAELGAAFDFSRPMRVSRAPGRLDVMGGIADYTGSMVCELTLDRAAAVVLQERADRELQIFSFNLYDEHKPFTLRVPLEALASQPAQALRKEFAEPGRQWAAYVAGCLFVLNAQGFINLRDPRVKGLNLALYSTVPMGAGVSSSAAVEVATMMNLRDHFDLMNPVAGRSLRIADRSAMGPLKLAELCQMAENRIVGAPCGIMDQVASCWGEAGRLLRMTCQPHELHAALDVPPGVRFVGINSGVRHSVGGLAYGRTRCAAFMAHRMIVEKMRQIGAAAGRRLVADPLRGYLANLDPDDYKRIFRPSLPEQITGREFLDNFGQTIDACTTVDPDVSYAVRNAADHHVLEARRVKNFAGYLEEAAAAQDPRQRGGALDRAGHLMYASHQSYTMDAMLGADECDLLVQLARKREPAGIYGAKITGGGCGGTVAILCDVSPKVDRAIAEIMEEYEKQTGRKPELFEGSSPGAWHVGTTLVRG